MDDVIEFLESYIWKNGFEMLSEKPFEVYKSMVGDGHGIDPRKARLVLVTLMSKSHEMARNGCPYDGLVSHIQREHCLNRKAAKELSSMYFEVFRDENRRLWNDSEEAGFGEFCKGEWTVDWAGNCDWNTKHGGSYPCSAEASLTFAVHDIAKLRGHLSEELQSNPFLSAEDIYGILARQIGADLDNDMDEYCNADDYYEPYFEEFVGGGTYESEAKWKSWGLRIIAFAGSGNIDFEP